MAYVQDVFDAAMGIMDELGQTGQAQTSDTEEYAYRTPAIMNMMVGELNMYLGKREDWLPMTSMEDFVPTADTNFALSAMPYGLAANLLIDENPTAASFYQQRYEELRAVWLMKQQAEVGDITDLYGGIPYGEFARW